MAGQAQPPWIRAERAQMAADPGECGLGGFDDAIERDGGTERIVDDQGRQSLRCKPGTEPAVGALVLLAPVAAVDEQMGGCASGAGRRIEVESAQGAVAIGDVEPPSRMPVGSLIERFATGRVPGEVGEGTLRVVLELVLVRGEVGVVRGGHGVVCFGAAAK